VTTAAVLVTRQFLAREGYAKKSSRVFNSIFILTAIMHFSPEKKRTQSGRCEKSAQKKVDARKNKYIRD
jgi:hypothetical protein